MAQSLINEDGAEKVLMERFVCMQKSPKKLYKYRSFSVNTLRLLDCSEVYYANPQSFNDPLDCKLAILVDTDRQTLEGLLYKMIFEKHGKDRALKEINNHRYESTQVGDYESNANAAVYYNQLLSWSVKDLLEVEFSGYGVLSLAKRWNCPLMWSHYADEHRGLCIEYDMRDAMFSDLSAVSYDAPRSVRVSEIVDWKIRGNLLARRAIIDRIFLSKSKQWRYELEWRSIVEHNGSVSSPAKVKSIYFGVRCDYSVIRTIVRLYAKSEDVVKFYSIVSQAEGFRLGRCEVDVNEIYECGIQKPAGFMIRDVFVDESKT